MRSLDAIDADLAACEVELQTLLARQAALRAERADAADAAALAAAARAPDPGDGDWDAAGYEWSEALEAVRAETFGLPSWRRHQRAVCNASLAGRDVIALLPSGAGKSLCYQAPALVRRRCGASAVPRHGASVGGGASGRAGATVVLSPLVALIADQVAALAAAGVAAASITAATGQGEAGAIVRALAEGALDGPLLYVTPERVAKSRRFLSGLQKAARAGLIHQFVVDEVHTVSSWGNDYRPDMKRGCALLREAAPGVPILAATATATADVLADVSATLRLVDPAVCRAAVDRPNLFWEVLPKPHRDAAALDALAAWVRARGPGVSGLVYALTRRECETVAAGLAARGVSAGHYHADLERPARDAAHAAWSAGRVSVLVCTVAFGMGISNPSVRFVAHYTLPKSLENLYQEGGRAGRDGAPARVALFWRLNDLLRQAAVVATDPGWGGRLAAVARYVASSSRCRRATLSAHFGDAPPACRGACDLCAAADRSTFDGAILAAAAARVLRATAPAGAPARATLAQLHTRWRSAAAGADAAVAKATQGATVEAALTAAVGAGFLAIDVTYSAYAANAYLTPTPRVALLESGRARLDVVAVAGLGDGAAAPARGAKRGRGGEEEGGGGRRGGRRRRGRRLRARRPRRPPGRARAQRRPGRPPRRRGRRGRRGAGRPPGRPPRRGRRRRRPERGVKVSPAGPARPAGARRTQARPPRRRPGRPAPRPGRPRRRRRARGWWLRQQVRFRATRRPRPF